MPAIGELMHGGGLPYRVARSNSVSVTMRSDPATPTRIGTQALAGRRESRKRVCDATRSGQLSLMAPWVDAVNGSDPRQGGGTNAGCHPRIKKLRRYPVSAI